MLLWGTLIAVFVMVTMMITSPDDPIQQIETSQFLQKIDNGEIIKVHIQGDLNQDSGYLKGETSDEKVVYQSYVSSGIKDVKASLKEKQVGFNERPQPPDNSWLFSMMFWVVIIVVGVMIFRRMQAGGAGGGGMMGRFTQNKATLYEQSDVRFTDVAGVDEAVEDVADVVGFLKEPDKYARLGGRTPRGILLTGNPGTGKTLLARAIAGEAGVPFFSISGSEFVEMFVGVGAARVRSLFEEAKKNAPCIIFIDEIDAVGRRLSSGNGNNNDEREQTLNQILVGLDGFEPNEGIIVLAATNRPDTLDPGLIRPGRFDRHVTVPMPDVKGREAIFGVHVRKLTLAKGIDLGRLAKKAVMMSGAAIEEICNEAALLAAKRGMESITADLFDAAIEKIQLGAERKGMVIHPEDLKIVSYHETGHALVGHLTPKCDKVDKVTIIPRGQALGLTFFLPEEARVLQTKGKLLAEIISLLGGRAAEELLDDVTVGAGNDLERATEIAKMMVCRFAMSDLPVRTYGSGQTTQVYQFIAPVKDYSEDTAKQLDEAVASIIDQCLKQARKLVSENRDKIEEMAAVLLEEETIDADRVIEIFGPRPTK